jgi:hypothetical protein
MLRFSKIAVLNFCEGKYSIPAISYLSKSEFKLIKYSTDMCHSCQGAMVILECNIGETSSGFIAPHHMLIRRKDDDASRSTLDGIPEW